MRVQPPAVMACAVAGLLLACASLPSPVVPEALKVGANESLALTAAAKGVPDLRVPRRQGGGCT